MYFIVWKREIDVVGKKNNLQKVAKIAKRNAQWREEYNRVDLLGSILHFDTESV